MNTNKNIINVYKPLSLSSLDIIKLFREKYPEYSQSTLSYAGRLDPMAHGVLILLVDDENLNRREHEKGNKVYEFKILIGFSTDTYDILGIVDKGVKENIKKKKYENIKSGNNNVLDIVIKEQIEDIIPEYTGKIMQSFPPYSAYLIKKRPLYIWASMGKLNEITIPEKEREIFSLELVGIEEINKEELLKEMIERLENVTGEFRQKEIAKEWESIFKEDIDDKQKFQIVTMRSEVSSGTYVRQLVHDIGKDLSINMCVFEIFRTSSGEFRVEDSLKV